MMSVRKILFGVFLIWFGWLFSLSSVNAIPNGANVSTFTISTSPNTDNPGNASAYAGNVSEVTLYAYSTTSSWQGYFGNVTGAIELSDGSSNVIYNWSYATPQGEVYMSTNSTIQWSYIQCLNFTANGTRENDDANAGQTSLSGTNQSQLETMFNINYNDADGVDETFTLAGVGTHDEFYTGNLLFTEGECMNTRIYSNVGNGENNKFEEVILYEPRSTSIVFTSLLENDMDGFDQGQHDFEALVLEDGHSGDATAVPYYFFVELG